MAGLSILIVEDDRLQCKALHDTLREWGHEAEVRETVAAARKAVSAQPLDLILLDVSLPDGNGLAFLEEIRNGKENTDAEVVMITAHTDVKHAVRAIRLGAYDYLTKPCEEEHLQKIVRNISRKAALDRQLRSLSRLTSTSHEEVWQLDEMIGADALQGVFDVAQRVAEAEKTTVLILGERGTGKGMLAKAIHRLSARRDKPFVDINCAAIPGQLLETELLGFEKGAFPDAKTDRPGLMEVADGGTVFLDEVGDMPLGLQSKLLKVIEDKVLRRVGGVKNARVDVRIIAATWRDLRTLVDAGKFRNDLYCRLSVFPLKLPPLRERPNVIVPLANHYLGMARRVTGRKVKGFTPGAVRAMQEYAWPGNVRELRNAVERAVILSSGDQADANALGLPGLSIPAVRFETAVPPPDGIVPMRLAECEKRVIESTLNSVSGNRNRAADILGIHRTTLYKKISEYGLQ